MKAYEVSIAVAGPQMAVAWHGGDEGADKVFLRRLKPDGAPAGPAIPVSDGRAQAFEPDLQLEGADAVVAWYEKDRAGRLRAWLSRIGADGNVSWRRSLDGAGGQARNPVARLRGGRIEVAWIETRSGAGAATSVWSQAFDAGGAPIRPARAVGQAGEDTWNLNAALGDQGEFYVVYDAAGPGRRAHEVQLIAISGYGVRRRQLTPDDGKDSLYPDIGVGPGGVGALTWFDRRDGNEEVYLALAWMPDLLRGEPLAPRRITHTSAPSIGAYLAWNGDRLALVWCDRREGQNELYAQTFVANGAPASPVARLTKTNAQSSIPSIRPLDDGFLIGWNEYRPGADSAHEGIAMSAAFTARYP